MKTGPKPKASRELIERYSVKQNFQIVKMLNRDEAKVRCTLCGLAREANRTNARLSRCRCQMVRKFQTLERTLKNTNEQLAELGLAMRYRCLKIGGQYATDKHEYRCLTCDHKFHVIASTFFHPTIQYPCPSCRRTVFDAAVRVDFKTFTSKLKKRDPNLQCLEVFDHMPRYVRVRDLNCGHEFKVMSERITQPSRKVCFVRCTRCHPTSVWFEFTVAGKSFKTRSNVERKFVEFLVLEKGVDVNRIEYEPKGYRVQYRHPIHGNIRSYSPDFKIGKTLIEVKDKSSLGLRSYHWMPQEHALKENRAKFKSALAEFEDFRVYCLEKDGFKRVRSLPSWRQLNGNTKQTNPKPNLQGELT